MPYIINFVFKAGIVYFYSKSLIFGQITFRGYSIFKNPFLKVYISTFEGGQKTFLFPILRASHSKRRFLIDIYGVVSVTIGTFHVKIRMRTTGLDHKKTLLFSTSSNEEK